MNRKKRLARADHRRLEPLTVRILAGMGPQGQVIRRHLELLYRNRHPAEERAAAGRRDLAVTAAGDTCDERD